jgi:2-keto-4-pentenoate hydratase/2-oxohepta-3-ene-1,7-dioic acid hydratase in catechol pathway
VRIAAFELDGAPRVGIVEDDRVRPFPPGVGALEAAAGAEGWEGVGAGDPVPLAGLALLPPVRPASIRDFVSFERHVEGAKRAIEGEAGVPESWYDAPTFLFLSPHSAIGSGAEVVPPFGTELLDFELEVAVVIGRDGRDLTPGQAADHIAGYLICNDWSARDLQKREMQMNLGPSKGKDFATTLGPWLVTPDELEPYRRGDRLDLKMTVAVNGVEVGADRLSEMAWSFEELIAYASRAAWVRAGDVIAAGTCAGGSLVEVWGRAGKQEPPPLSAGDVVTMTVDGLGSISNPIVAPRPEASPIPRARRS